MIKLFRRIKNYFFCLKYPIWKFINWSTGKPDYSTTWYTSIPEGWRKAFGKQLSKDLMVALKQTKKWYYRKYNKKLKTKDALKWADIKEKYGSLRLDASMAYDKFFERVFDKYELLSIGYCIDCGKPARYRTRGWIEYYCKDCFTSHRALHLRPEDIQKELEECKLTKKDIPVIYVYNKALNGKIVKKRVSIKKKYNIDYIKLWGLK